MMSRPPSCFADLLEGPVDAGVGRDVALDDDVGPGLLGQLSHAALEALALVGEREPRARAVKRLRDRPCDRPLVGHTGHQRELAVQNPVGHVTTPFPLAPLTLARPEFDSVEPGHDRLERLALGRLRRVKRPAEVDEADGHLVGVEPDRGADRRARRAA